MPLFKIEVEAEVELKMVVGIEPEVKTLIFHSAIEASLQTPLERRKPYILTKILQGLHIQQVAFCCTKILISRNVKRKVRP